MRNVSFSKRGFTMIEILVAITIIGILITLGIRSYMSSQMKARDLRRKADLHNLAKPLEAYFNDYGEYPLDDGTGQIEDDLGNPLAWGSAAFEDSKGTVYMSQLPDDPRGDRNYWYESDGTEWAISALLENANDPDIAGPFAGTACQPTVECTFQVSSTN